MIRRKGVLMIGGKITLYILSARAILAAVAISLFAYNA